MKKVIFAGILAFALISPLIAEAKSYYYSKKPSRPYSFARYAAGSAQISVLTQSYFGRFLEGQDILLSWTSTNAASCRLTGNFVYPIGNQIDIEVPVSGQLIVSALKVSPTYPGNRYTITCLNGSGQSFSDSASIYIVP